MPIIGFLVTAAQWILGFLVARWIAYKILWVTILVVVVPWVLKDGIQWFWKVGEEYRSHVLDWLNSFIAQALGTFGLDHTINITGVAGYMATQMGFLDYVSIVITGWGICWGLKILGKIF